MALSAKIKQKLDVMVANSQLLEALVSFLGFVASFLEQNTFINKEIEYLFQKIEDVYEVGSVKTETALAGSCVADIVIITSSLPTCEPLSLFPSRPPSFSRSSFPSG